ncbi:S9 family peptidase [Pseudoxanthomonas sp. PXM02]|uniref:S9 family peptidase n=1 Tax=Pseudoxanthomonas sp. PXM02 TaxID=2769294 RepID=UPI001786C407|nr:S9 family peptidase [Pseudoxanthomonas sp. PXM02]MBD9479626.1 S9 family peptidase [Pseudoxanthomonas sp. PXM02]
MIRGILAAIVAGIALASFNASAQVDVEAFVRKDKFADIKLSPSGEFYAATVRLEDRTGLAIMLRSGNKLTAHFVLGKNTHVSGFWWVNPERVLIAISEKYGALDEPQPTGELYGINADGTQLEMLVGYRVESRGAGTRIQPKKVEDVAAFLVDTLPDDDKNVIISVWPFSEDPYTRAERMDVYSGRRTQVARAPVRRASFVTDNAGVVRFTSGAGADNVRKLYYRPGDASEWTLINDESVSGIGEYAIGFSSDNRTAYLLTEQRNAPTLIVAYDLETGQRTTVLQDAVVDPHSIIFSDGVTGLGAGSRGGRVPVGALYMDGRPRTAFFDKNSKEALLQRELEHAFAGHLVSITSITSDGRVALVQVSSDRNPGDFYLFRTNERKADYLLSRRDWFDPDAMAESKPVQWIARDGLVLHGYLTVPKGTEPRNLPLIVLPHGGPFGIRDTWHFNDEAQMLAGAGYAVLQPNFRGSGGYGRAFLEAGARQWGLAMQDDVTDATRWAIRQGIADPRRICIYGASYGAYAALSGVVKEPDLYRCAAGYVGVYDLPMMQREDARQSLRLGRWSKDWVGEAAGLAAVSPVNMAQRVKVPVFMAAGGEDEVAPIKHTELMERRLKAAGVPVETLYYKTEGHGFYVEANQREYYTKLLAFFNRHLGGAKAK